jgi:5-methyltetrahydrofolate--homocysteine methyltransferase
MAIEGLVIIGESINDSVPSTKKLFDANDIDGILELAKGQDERGATYIDVNVGIRSPEFMADMVKKVQQVTSKPLSIDTPDMKLAAAGLDAYDQEIAGGQIPVLNSISPLRTEMFSLYESQPFMPILLATERVEDGGSKANKTAEETYLTAKELLNAAKDSGYGFTNEQCIIDPGIAPIGSDSEGQLKRVIGSLKLMQEDPDFEGVHRSVGLSNFSIMLPPKRGDGSPVKGPLESAFLTLAVPLGLDMIIGSTKRNYQTLPDDHPALLCLNDALQMEGFDVITRVMQYYS